MYWKLLVDAVGRRWSGPRRPSRVGTVTELVIGLMVVGALVAEYEHHRGNYTRLKARLEAPAVADTAWRPGGLDPIVLSRSPNPGSPNPEFLSVTLLPGRGMDVLGIRANIPGKGEVELLDGSSVEDAARAMTGSGDDAAGEASLTHGGAILSPWAGRLGGVVAPDGKTVAVTWKGRRYDLPADRTQTAEPAASGGLLGKAAAESTEMSPMPDGGSVTALFPASAEGWGAGLETKVSVLMSSRVMDVTVVVKNTGGEPRPVGVGWAPRLVLPSGDRAKVTLRVPAAARSVIGNAKTGMPSGELASLSGAYGFNAPRGMALGKMSLNDTFVHLRAKFDQNPTIELRDAGSRVGLRLMAMSPTIRAVHVFSPAHANFVGISPQMNYDDPFGREWGEEDTGMKVLEPGQTVEWRVRLELFSLMSSGASLP